MSRAAFVLAAALILCGPWTGRARGAAAPLWASSRIDRVVVYSTQARVFRTATVTRNSREPREVVLASLPTGVLPDSVRVTCKTATVSRVEVRRMRGVLPRQADARKLVQRIEGLLDRRDALAGEQRILRAELAFVRGLTLRREPRATGRRPAQEGLFPAAWGQILAWAERRAGALRARLTAIRSEQRKVRQGLHRARVEGKELDPVAADQLQRVLAVLGGGPGKHRVTVSYRVGRVRWVPAYDLRYRPSARKVEATYYAVVRQRTGEDWDDAALRFSTGRPTELLAVPRLSTVVLGRKRDFVPKPRPRREPNARVWKASAPEPTRDPLVDRLRSVLRQTGQSPRGGENKRGTPDTGARVAPDDDAEPPSPAKTPKPRPEPSVARKKSGVILLDEATIEGNLARPEAAPPAEPSPAGGAGPMGSARPVSRRSRGVLTPTTMPPRERVPWTEQGYRPPRLDPDLPAAAARGYLYVMYAPGRHSIPAAGKNQRVPLLRHTLAVRPVHRVVPGLSEHAYLMATVKNSTGRPILRGHANLFAGKMFSGRSWLNTALPGREITLPLGVDDAVKVARHLQQRTVSTGMLFKDDVTAYTIKIEVANNHGYPIKVNVRDQIPLTKGRKIEVRGFSARPAMGKPDDDGKVEWTGTIPPRSVRKLKITFQIVRPKDWKLRQHHG